VENVGGAWPPALLVDVRRRFDADPVVGALLVAVFAELLDERRWIRECVDSPVVLLGRVPSRADSTLRGGWTASMVLSER